MDIRNAFQRSATAAPRRGGRAARIVNASFLAWALALAWAFGLAATPAAGAGFRFITDNDFLGDGSDDLYSFGVGVELHRGRYTVTIKENGFTDREAGIRFDETYLTIGRPLPLSRGWQGWGEMGLVHVGNGLLGETFQNEFHDAIGADTVHLRYVDDGRLSPVASFAATRLFPAGERLAFGPYLEASVTQGHKAHALAAAQASWHPRGPLSVAALVGARSSQASLDALERRMGGTDVQAEVSLIYRDRIALSWSYNASGTRQEHLAIGYRIGTVTGFARALTR